MVARMESVDTNLLHCPLSLRTNPLFCRAPLTNSRRAREFPHCGHPEERAMRAADAFVEYGKSAPKSERRHNHNFRAVQSERLRGL